MNWKKPVSLVLSLALAASLAVPALADEKPADWTPADGARVETPWYAAAQTYVTDKGWMIGTDKGFEPNKTVTRAEVYQTLWNMEGSPVVEAPTEHLLQMSESLNGILDVWFTNSARWAYREGLTTGAEGGRYEGGRAMTRAELATALYRWVQSKDQGFTGAWMFLLDFDDADQVPEWADEAMHWMTMKKVINGKGNERTLACQDTATRAELAQMLMKLDKVMNGMEADAVTGTVTEIEKYGHAVLDVKIEDFNAAGFALGDIVTVTAGEYSADMPYLDGYYVDSGELMLRAYPGKEFLAVCINYGKFNEVAGVEVGDTVSISLKEKEGALALQATYSLKYTNDRADYASDEVFANFRSVIPGKLYRSASPVNNENNRAATADALVKAAGVKTVMNMADTQEEIDEYLAAEDFASPYYKSLLDAKKVAVLGMPVNYASDEFAESLVEGLTFLAQNEGPYLIHCTEGKDRAGCASAFVEALMGASLDEIVADYMKSYENYYGVKPGDDKYDLIAEGNVKEMLRAMAGLEKGADLTGVDLQKAAETYLTAHGMKEVDLKALVKNLTPDALTGKAVAASKYGNVGTDITGMAVAAAGFEVGDILKVEITGQEALMIPFGTGYSNVDTGKPIALMDTSVDTLALAINMGNFASTYALGTKDEENVWTFADKTITVSMGEKAGYLEEYEIRNIDALRTNDRADYASDEVFANFRAVTIGDIADGKLYRGSSPVNPELGRNTYVDAFLKANGVKTVIDLADSEEEYEGYEGVKESYAYTTNTVKLDMGVDFAAEDFAAKLKTGLEYMLSNEGPYYVHCNEGKDRCGFVSMVLEMLMGGKADEIVDDYMLSYENYYGVEHDSDRWNRIATSNVIANLLKLTGAEDQTALAKADLVKAAETYLTDTVGLTADQVTALKTTLSK